MSRYRKSMADALNEVYKGKNNKFVVYYVKKGNPDSMISSQIFDNESKAKDFENKMKAQGHKIKQHTNEASDDHEISMARGELEAIADKATQLASALQGKSDDGNPLEAWVQSKITKAKDYINSVSDYMMYNPDMKQNESHGPKIFTNDKGSIEKVGDKFHTYKGDKKSVHDTLDDAKSALNENKGFTDKEIKMAYGVLNDPRYKQGNYTGAVNAIEKIKKGLSKHPDVANALKRANEDTKGRPSPANPTGKDLEEATSHTVRYTDPLNKKRFAVPFKTHAAAEKKMAQLKKDGVKDIKITMDTLKPGINFKEEYIMEKTYDEKDIDKFHTGLDKLVHKHFGHSSDEKKEKEDIQKEETQLDEFTSKMIKDLQKSYADLKGKTISPEKATALSKHLDKLDVNSLRQLVKANLPFVSTIAKNKVYKKTGKFEEVDMNEAEDYGLMGRITPAQLKNIKDIWAKKTKMDITPGVRKMLDRMDIPTKLAIQQAKINVLSDLVKEDVEKEYFSQPRTVGAPGYGTAHPMHPSNRPSMLDKIKKMFKLKKEMYGNKQIDPTTATALRTYLKGRAGGAPFPPVVEGKIKDIFTANKEGESVEKIAKRLSMPVADVKKILGEEKDGVEIAKIRAARDKEDDKEVASKDKEIESLKDQINILKTKLENEKNRAIKPEPNPDTGEVPLTVGIAHKILKDKREKEMKKEGVEHPAKAVFESIAAVKKKAEKTGMPYSILKQVYDRGMAAWKGGHRPGATQVQWALARVNSFVTKSSGTWGGADKDLAAKVRGSKK